MTVIEVSPRHCAPPNLGSGLSQVLVRVTLASPSEQNGHSSALQSDHPPAMGGPHMHMALAPSVAPVAALAPFCPTFLASTM